MRTLHTSSQAPLTITSMGHIKLYKRISDRVEAWDTVVWPGETHDPVMTRYPIPMTGSPFITRQGSGTYVPQLSPFTPATPAIDAAELPNGIARPTLRNAPRDAMHPTPMALLNPEFSTVTTGSEKSAHHDGDAAYWDALLDSEGLGIIESAEDMDQTWDTLSLESHSSGTAGIMEHGKFQIRGNRTGSHHRSAYEKWMAVVFPAWLAARKESKGFTTTDKRTLKAMEAVKAGKSIGMKARMLILKAETNQRAPTTMPAYKA